MSFSRRPRPLGGWAGVGLIALAAIALAPSVSADQQADPQVTPQTQQVAPPQTPQPTVQGAIPDRTMADRIVLLAGRSLPLSTEFDVKGYSINDPEVADLIVKGPRELLLNGKKPGTISMIIWGDSTRIHHEVAIVNAVTPSRAACPGCHAARRAEGGEIAKLVLACGAMDGARRRGRRRPRRADGCDIIVAPLTLPPPHGVKGLTSWMRRWVTTA